MDMGEAFVAFGTIAFLVAAWRTKYDKFKKTGDPLTRLNMREDAKKILEKKKSEKRG